MNVHVSPSTIVRPSKTSDLDATLKAAITAHAIAARAANQADKEFVILKDRHPELADRDASITLSVTEFWQTARLCPRQLLEREREGQELNECPQISSEYSFRQAFALDQNLELELSPELAERWRLIECRIREVTPVYLQARRRAGITKAEDRRYAAVRAERRAFEKVLAISPATRSGCRILAKFLRRQLPRYVGGPLTHQAYRKYSLSAASYANGEMFHWNWRRGEAFDALSRALLRLAA